MLTRKKTIHFISLISFSIMDAFAYYHSTPFAAFGFAHIARPPPMIRHYYPDLCRPGVLKIGYGGSSSTLLVSQKDGEDTSPHIGYTSPAQPRIAIIGGGIAGVTAANALSRTFAANNISPKIVVFEGDEKGSNNMVNFQNHEHPTWVAATARNANTICPGATWHIMSQRTTLVRIMKDTVREWFEERLESVQCWLQKEHFAKDRLLRVDNFDVVPPYFALHLFRCLGPSASWDERATFVTFLKSFLKTSVFSTEHDVHERGKLIHQIANSNRNLFLETIKNSNDLASKTGLGRGFISLYRNKSDTLHDFEEGLTYGEDFSILSFEEAVKLEPRILNLPITGQQLFGLHRKDDYTADCASFIREMTNKVTQEYGVQYLSGELGKVDDICLANAIFEESSQLVGSKNRALATDPVLNQQQQQEKQRFSLRTMDGRTHDFDFIVLAAGVNTPLFARILSIGGSCPTYPLRGYSLTVYSNSSQSQANESEVDARHTKNLLNQPLKVDDMYCSSVGENMARIAGFGELCGFRDKAANVPSLAPKVLARYCKQLFPEAKVIEADALQCFRPLSPDDIPIVGAVKSVPGVFLHTGHGTLGWTLCLATAECLAQAMTDDISSTFDLPGDISIERHRLSPDRFL